MQLIIIYHMLENNIILLTILINFFTANVLIYLTINIAKKYFFLDIPNSRSLHQKKIPNIGGMPVIGLFLLNSYFFMYVYNFSKLEIYFIFSLSIIYILGLIDDLYNLSSFFRFFIQIIVGFFLINFFNDYYKINFIFEFFKNYIIYTLFFVIFITWFTNLFNFMDGINGLVAINSFLYLVTILIFSIIGNFDFPNEYINFLILISILSIIILAFIPWNFPSSKIFMGDSCSSVLGFFIAFVFIFTSTISIKFFWISLVLLVFFIIDTSLTLFLRIIKKDNIFLPHKTHAYQILTQFLDSHFLVTIAQTFIFLLILIPISYLILINSIDGLFATIIVYFLVFIIYLLIKRIKLV